jgi:hypothetical protein
LKTIAWHWIAVRCAVFLPTHDAAQAHDTLTMTQSGPPVERTRHPVEWPREVQSIIGATENPGDTQDLSLPVGSRCFYQAIDIF